MGILNNIVDEANETAIVGTSYSTISGIIAVILNTMTGIGISLAVIFAINAGIKIMAARGDPRAAAEGKKAFTFAIFCKAATNSLGNF